MNTDVYLRSLEKMIKIYVEEIALEVANMSGNTSKGCVEL